MWKIITSALTSLVAKPIEQWQERKTLKVAQKFELLKLEHETKKAKANSMLEMAKQGQAQDYDLDKLAMKNMQNSWKDELVLIVFLTPMILAFIPNASEYALQGFKIIEKMPSWYVAIIIGMVVVIYGLRGLLKNYMAQRSSVSNVFKQ
jgi:hypothetical protein